MLRLSAATLVLVSHSFALAGHREPSFGDTSLGIAGVEIFFVISGFLVAGSWLAQPRPGAFLFKRSLRIVPALVLTLLLTAFVLGPLVTSVSTSAYLGSSAPARYVGDNLLAVVSADAVEDLAYRLPGVFKDNTSDVVNGSLWTLPVEVGAYLLVLVLGLLGVLRRWLWLPVGVALVALAGPESSSLNLLLLSIFGVSALLYVHRERMPMRPWLAVAALALWAASAWLPFSGALAAIAVPYLVIYVAYAAPKGLRRLTEPGDVSYGLYLLAFPVQQTIVLVAGARGLAPLALALIAFPITYVLALLSWRAVERPTLGLKRVVAPLRRPRSPSAAARPAGRARRRRRPA